MLINVIIIDDDKYSCETLERFLNHYSLGFKLNDCFDSAHDAIASPKFKNVGLIMIRQGLNNDGLEKFVPSLKLICFELIFISTHENYVTQSFRFGEPSFTENDATPKNSYRDILQTLLRKLNKPVRPFSRIALPTMEGLLMVSVDTIVSCSSERNYSVVHLKNQQKTVISRNLKELEKLLVEYSFFRVHHSHLVNLNEVSRYKKDEGGYLLMTDGSRIDISRSRKEALLRNLRQND